MNLDSSLVKSAFIGCIILFPADVEHLESFEPFSL